ncbi:hypothetical protein [Azospirillum canadense]|uniref:hypothetical protein n=1 Tax=Azospirillum canadense TaxID=403962 RepID=UPI00222642B8|nr:hypothetical protein [Azospirillum canadense]MCW2240689.1 hypothetical protein [Azospirillum canadense]
MPLHSRRPTTPALAGWRAIVRHPAFRLGVLDALSGRPFDADNLLTRLARPQAPADAQTRRRKIEGIFTAGAIQLAQTRYEEGRMAVLEHGLACQSWTNPTRPPASVRAFVARLAAIDSAARARRQHQAVSATDRHARPPVWPTLPL